MFGLVTSPFGGNKEHYVGNDDIREWLLNSDFEPTHSNTFHEVKAPAGYVFHKGYLYSQDSEFIRDFDELTDTAKVSAETPYDDKALMALDVLKLVKEEEFNAMQIPEQDILRIFIYAA